MVIIYEIYLRKGESEATVGSEVVESSIEVFSTGIFFFLKIECSKINSTMNVK